jgi:outer membrane receptor protein involved in Fe transport
LLSCPDVPGRRNPPRPPRPGRKRFKTLSYVLAAALVPALSGPVGAEDPAPQADPEPPPELRKKLEELAKQEVITVWGERPDKPFDRDTELRLTGKELAERGAVTLDQALELIPELNVREAGRGGRQIDIRGARKGSIKILIDGIPVDDPYYGNFDISSIPVTDIEQIRVSASPASPIDGTGGPGGVVEVHTRDAVGPAMVRARVQGSSLPAADAAATGRARLTETLALRVSGSGTLGSRDFTVVMPGDTLAELDEGKQSGNGALRLEHRDGARRAVVDAWLQHRSFVVPPGEDDLMDILVIDGETSARVGASADDRVGKLRLQARAYAHALERQSTYYADATLAEMRRREDLSATRAGAAFLANRPFGSSLHLIGSMVLDSEEAQVDGFDGAAVGGRATTTELAAGAQFERGRFTADAAAGLAIPIGIDAEPWPEFKLGARWQPVPAMGIEATLARKGRVPTLRERFRLDVGNQALGPEHAGFGEVAVDLTPVRAVTFEVAGYLRRTNGLIRYDSMQGSLINTGELDMSGIDLRLKVAPRSAFSGGASYSFTEAWSAESGLDPLDHLAAHRADAWLTWAPDRFGGTARVHHVGERIDRNQILPSYEVVDLSLFAHLPRGLFGSARVDNVLGEQYELRVGGVRAPGRVFSLLLQGEWQ